jgi:anti-sigma factor RsiW
MSVSDEQIELLESYIDGELPAGDEDSLRRRLEAEPALASALETLRQERDLRMVAWQSCEPSEASVKRLIARVDAAVDRHNAWAYRIARYRIPFAAAACIIVGFMVGYVGRGPQPANLGNGGDSVASAPNVVQSPAVAGINTVSNPLDQPVDLPIVNEYGQQVAVQHFNTRREAEKFIEDLNRWQKTQEQIKQNNIAPVGAEKF